MRIGMIGTGYVGLVSSVCLAESGHKLVCVDKREEIVESLQKGVSPIFEQDIEEMLGTCIAQNAIEFSIDFSKLKDCDLIFLAVGTPSLPNGHADLSQVFSAIDELVHVVSEDTVLAIRSTIPVGTMKKIRNYLDSKSRENQMLGFCPEFLREGLAISDFLNPRYLVFCSDTEEGQELLHQAYMPIIKRVEKTQSEKVQITKCTSYETAELIKYTINSFLATKITFINQIAQLALVSGADIQTIIQTIGADDRIGRKFINPGPGFGGSCFPKDTLALVKCGMSYGIDMSLVAEANQANVKHKEFIVSWLLESLEAQLDIEQHIIAVWGLSFKADTDDVRDSSAITIIENLFGRGIRVNAYDPQGNNNFRMQVNNTLLTLSHSALDAVKGASVLLVLTEWKEFASLEPQRIKEVMRGDAPFVFDTRGILSSHKFTECGFRMYKFGH